MFASASRSVSNPSGAVQGAHYRAFGAGVKEYGDTAALQIHLGICVALRLFLDRPLRLPLQLALPAERL